MEATMRTSFGALVTLFLGMALAAGALAGDLTDPYEVLHRHFEAVGGLERARAERSTYSEGSIEIVGTGLEGTFRSWGRFPLYSRQELDLTLVTQTSGDNGEFRWLVDQNGKIRIIKDEATMERREISAQAAAYDYLDPDSDTFDLALEGIEKSGELDCYVLKLTNTLNDDVTRLFFDTEGFLLRRKEDIEPDEERHTTFGDHREVEGFRVPFRQETKILPIGQHIVVELTEYRSNPEIDPALFEPPGEDVKDFTFTDGASSAEIPFEFVENHIYLMVNVGGKERRWVLDTGASSTVVDRAFARELGLEIEGEIKGQGVSQTVDVSFVTLPSLSIETLSLAEQKVVTIDIGWLFRKTMGADFEVVGILGYDFLSRFVTRVDYAAEMLVFHDPDAFTYEGEGVVLDAPLVGSNFAPNVTVDGELSGRWNLDLGASGQAFHYPFAAERGLLDREGVESVGFGAGGSMKDRTVEFDSIEFAGFTIEKPLIDVTLEKGEGAFGQEEMIGNLGNSLFRHFVLHLDYARQHVVVEKGADFETKFPRSKSGLQVVLSDAGGWEVFFVSPGTPADKAGFEVGDLVESINGIDVEHLGGLIALRKMMRSEAGTKYEFGIRREGKEKKLRLTLRDLF
jgi:outer membrane lipoprotein-sorting protein